MASVYCWIKKKKKKTYHGAISLISTVAELGEGSWLTHALILKKVSQIGNRKQEDGGVILASSFKETQMGFFFLEIRNLELRYLFSLLCGRAW